MNGHTLVRDSTSLVLGAARLPLSAAEVIARHTDEPTWPPTLAFSEFEARVRRVVGSLAGDGELEAQGHLEEARLAELRESLRLEGAAQQRRIEAEERFRSRRQRDEKVREQVNETAEEAEEKVEEAQRQAKADIDTEARRRQRAGRQADEQAQRKREARGRSSRRQSIEEERDAIDAAKQAAEADAAIEQTDEQIRRSKSSR